MANKMTRVYPTYDEKLVKNTILYGNDGKLYLDETFENEVTPEELKNLFFKGLIVAYEDMYIIPTSLEVTNSDVTVTAHYGSDSYDFTAIIPAETE